MDLASRVEASLVVDPVLNTVVDYHVDLRYNRPALLSTLRSVGNVVKGARPAPKARSVKL